MRWCIEYLHSAQRYVVHGGMSDVLWCCIMPRKVMWFEMKFTCRGKSRSPWDGWCWHGRLSPQSRCPLAWTDHACPYRRGACGVAFAPRSTWSPACSRTHTHRPCEVRVQLRDFLFPLIVFTIVLSCCQGSFELMEGVNWKNRFFLGNSPKQRTPPTHRYGLGLT